MAGEYTTRVAAGEWTETVEWSERHRYPGGRERMRIYHDGEKRTVEIQPLPVPDRIPCSEFWYGDAEP